MSEADAIEPMNAVEFSVNGALERTGVRSDELLLETLRERFGLTSVRGTCGIGVCGTCTVLVDGRPISACLTLTMSVADATVTTAEGLAEPDGHLAPVQRAFLDCQAYQCSFCIPAMTVAMHACLKEEATPTLDDVREYLGGNLCRCGTYPQILAAARSLLSESAAESEEES